MNEESTFHYPTADLTQGRPFSIGDLWTLLTKPKEFFMSGIAFTKQNYIYCLMVLVGVDVFISKLDGKLIGMPSHSEFYIQISNLGWLMFFPLTILLGSISGMFAWHIGGWWYNLRLKWSGAKDFTPDNGRTIFMYNNLIPAIAAIILVSYQAFIYSNYYEASTLDGGIIESILGIAAMVLGVMAIVNSYRSVTSLFEVRKGVAMIWFLVLPIVMIFLALAMGIFIALAQM